MSTPMHAPAHHKHHALSAWPEPGRADGHHHGSPTARQLFESLDTDGDGLVSVQQVADAWPRPPGTEAAAVREVVARLAAATGRAQLKWPEFRAVVRLWHATGGRPPSLRSYIALSTAEAAASVAMAAAASQAASIACATGAESSWPQLAAIGGMGALIALAPLDASGVRPVLNLGGEHNHVLTNLGPNARRALFAAASASAGILLAPVVPLLAGTIGDPQTHGYGPLAVIGVAAAHLAGQVVALAAVPKGWLTARGTVATAALGGGVVATLVGLAAAHAAGRAGAQRPVLLAAGALSTHAAVTAAIAARCFERGEPEPLHPALTPVLHMLALAQRLLPRASLG